MSDFALNTIKQNLNFRDSFLFLPLSLRNLADAFHLPTRKGHFPHTLNTIENENRAIPFPEPEKFYDLEELSPQSKLEFLKWYKAAKAASGGKYYVSSQLLKYCKFETVCTFPNL